MSSNPRPRGRNQVGSSLAVSVVIPTYNYGTYVTQALDSVLAQTLTPHEVIVVDDGSTDDTADRIKSYEGHLRYIRQPNRGLSAARNTGLRAATGEWVALLDSDDVWLPPKLEMQASLCRSLPAVGIVATGHFSFTGPDPWAVVRVPPLAPPAVEVGLEDLLESGAFGSSSVIIRRDALEAVGLFDETLRSVEDLDMWLRIAARFPIQKLNGPLTGVRLHPHSMSTRVEPMRSSHARVLHRAFTTIPRLAADRRAQSLGWARLHREAAWLRYVGGDRVGACIELAGSVVRWPRALRDAEGRVQRWRRAKLLLRFLLLR